MTTADHDAIDALVKMDDDGDRWALATCLSPDIAQAPTPNRPQGDGPGGPPAPPPPQQRCRDAAWPRGRVAAMPRCRSFKPVSTKGRPMLTPPASTPPADAPPQLSHAYVGFVEGHRIEGAARGYLQGRSTAPLFLCGDAVEVLRALPAESVDCAMTSPPYWGKREYADGGIGLEGDYREYIDALLAVVRAVHRVLKPTGSFWLNIGDSYLQKNLLGIPWRVAHRMTDEQGWTLRNDVIWHKVKGGPDNAKDKLRNTHEHVFHFVKKPKGYFYDDSAVRTPPKKAKVVNGSVVSATGVTGVRYHRQIELSTSLSPEEKAAALKALGDTLSEVAAGNIADFRMVIRKQQRATHSDSGRVSGRARELEQKGFYFLRYHPDGSKLSDVWDVLPEDTQKRSEHFAPYPEDLCRVPLAATCPAGGVVLDPFCGTGTTMLVARRLGLRSIGVDLSPTYLRLAADRCRGLL